MLVGDQNSVYNSFCKVPPEYRQLERAQTWFDTEEDRIWVSVDRDRASRDEGQQVPARFFDVEFLLMTLLTLKLAIIMRDMLIDILTSVIRQAAAPVIIKQKESGVGPN